MRIERNLYGSGLRCAQIFTRMAKVYEKQQKCDRPAGIWEGFAEGVA